MIANRFKFQTTYLRLLKHSIILPALKPDGEDAKGSHAQPRGQLKITAPTTFGSEVLMPALQCFRVLAPEVTLEIGLTDRNVDIVDEGFGIAFRIEELPDGRLIACHLAPYGMMIVPHLTILRDVVSPTIRMT